MADADEEFEDVDVGLPLEHSSGSDEENGRGSKEDANELALTVDTKDEVPTGVGQSKRNPGKNKLLWALLLVGLAVIALVAGLAVGLTQNNNKQTGDASVASTTDVSAEGAGDENALSDNLPRPVIIDLDYGAFPDDIFALALALELNDIMDVRAVVATSMDPTTSALCMAQHLEKAGRPNVDVIVGEDIHGLGVGIWADDALVGFPLREKCLDVDYDDMDAVMSTLGGLDDLAEMMDDSKRNDWVYISLGGMTSLSTLTKEYPDATDKIEDLIVMAANICSDMEIYPFVFAPVQETNAAADPDAANFVFSKEGPGKNFYIMPVDPGQGTIDGEHYERIMEAAESDTCPGAAALIDFYSEWNKQARADETILTHSEAIEYDPKVSSALRYDPTCVLYAAQLLTKGEEKDDYVTTEVIPGIWFDDDAYTYIEEGFKLPAPNVCPALTELKFDLAEYTDRRSVVAAVGYRSIEAHEEFLDVMADALACARQ